MGTHSEHYIILYYHYKYIKWTKILVWPCEDICSIAQVHIFRDGVIRNADVDHEWLWLRIWIRCYVTDGVL